MSVPEESEAFDVLAFLTKESQAASSVWGDIYRNRFLVSVVNPPVGLTPDQAYVEMHPGIDTDKLLESKLASSL